jgi:hypothetical protein
MRRRCMMALNIKNVEVERLAEEFARFAGETKTEAVRRALEERPTLHSRLKRARRSGSPATSSGRTLTASL